MIWVVSKSLVASKEELDSRHQIIQEITQAKVTPWTKQCCIGARWPWLIEFYQCTSQKGEYGLIITAHMNIEVQPILQQILSQKKALVVINSCEIQKSAKEECYRIITSKNSQRCISPSRKCQILDIESIIWRTLVPLAFRQPCQKGSCFSNDDLV